MWHKQKRKLQMLNQKNPIFRSMLWVSDEIICVPFRPAVAKLVPPVPMCITLGCWTKGM
jgi:hypothetical protein